MVQATGDDRGNLFPGVTDDDLRTWSEQATWFSPRTLSDMAESIARSLSQMSGVTAPKLQVELLAAHLLALTADGQPETVSKRQEAGGALHSETTFVAEPPTAANALPIDIQAPSAPPAPEISDKGVSLLQPWEISTLSRVWPQIIDDLAQQKRSLWVALSATKPLALDDDVVTIGFLRRADAEILKKPQGPGSPLPNADLLRDAIDRHTGHRVRFTVGELEKVPSVASLSDSSEHSWPAGSGQGSQTPDVEPNEAASLPPKAESGDTSQAEEDSAQAAPIATRGEPVVRQLLGGELVAEELLDSMSHEGESDV